VHRAFFEGATAVQLQAQMSAGGTVVAARSDVLADGTCLNQLTADGAWSPWSTVGDSFVGTPLRDLLEEAHSFGSNDLEPSGLVIIDLARPSPECATQHRFKSDDDADFAYVAAVVEAVESENMREHVLLSSFSPSMLEMAAKLAPDMARQLAVDASQFPTDTGTAAKAETVTEHYTSYSSPQEFIDTMERVGAQSVGLQGNVLIISEDGYTDGGDDGDDDDDDDGDDGSLNNLLPLLLFRDSGFGLLTLPLGSKDEERRALELGVDAICTNEVSAALTGNGIMGDDLDLAVGDGTSTASPPLPHGDNLDIAAGDATSTASPPLPLGDILDIAVGDGTSTAGPPLPRRRLRGNTVA